MSEGYIEIDLKKLEDNVGLVKSVLSNKTDIIAVVKGNAYGHGAVEISKHLNRIGIFNFAVSSLDEAILLRTNKIEGEILAFGYTDSNRILEIKKYDISQTLISLEHAKELENKGVEIKCHLKIDTGMNRQGINHEEIRDIISVFNFENLNIRGIYSHLSASDSLVEEDIDFTKKQIDRFDKVIDRVKAEGFHPKTHIQSSYGVLNYNHHHYNFVRIGILMYGSLTSPEDKPKISLDLQPILSLKAPIVSINNIKEGERIGYSNLFIAKRDMTLALLPIGYTDGIDRNLSCRGGEVLVKGQRSKITGKISMDNMIIDISNIKEISLGDYVVLIGEDSLEAIRALEIAKKNGSITPEVFSSLSYRLDRRFI